MIPISEKLAARKILPGISAWVLKKVEKGYRIQFACHPPCFNGVDSHYCETRAGAFTVTRAAISSGQRGHRICSPSRERVRLPQQILPGSQEGQGVEIQQQKECSLYNPKNSILSGHMGFDHDAGTAVSCSNRDHSQYPEQSQARPRSHCSSVSKNVRSASTMIPMGLLHMRPF